MQKWQILQVDKQLLIPPLHLLLLNPQCGVKVFMFHACLKVQAKCHIPLFLQIWAVEVEIAHNLVPNLTWMAPVGKRMSIVKQGRSSLTFGTILTSLSSFNYAESPYWQSMIDAVAITSLGFKTPASERLRTDLLLESVDDLNQPYTCWACIMGRNRGAPSWVMDGQIRETKL